MNILSYLITWNAEYLHDDDYEPPARQVVVTDNCDGTQTVTGANIRTVTKHLQGTTQEGDRSRVATHHGGGVWTVSAECWDTKRKR